MQTSNNFVNTLVEINAMIEELKKEASKNGQESVLNSTIDAIILNLQAQKIAKK